MWFANISSDNDLWESMQAYNRYMHIDPGNVYWPWWDTILNCQEELMFYSKWFLLIFIILQICKTNITFSILHLALTVPYPGIIANTSTSPIYSCTLNYFVSTAGASDSYTHIPYENHPCTYLFRNSYLEFDRVVEINGLVKDNYKPWWETSTFCNCVRLILPVFVVTTIYVLGDLHYRSFS